MMKFKSDKQRKCVMALLRSSKNMTNKQFMRTVNMLQKKKFISKTMKIQIMKEDFDRDGVMNMKDCKPFNPMKQGKLHDLAVGLLRKREERIEKKREKELMKLEDAKDRLKERKAQRQIRLAQIKQKQAVIDEINREKQEIKDLKKANKEAKKAIFKESVPGRFITKTGDIAFAVGKKELELSQKAVKATKKFLKDPRTKKAAKFIRKALKDEPTRKRKGRKKKDDDDFGFDIDF